jgi:FtsP/CotA-like multicopper oxidase with cupredoxin domain
MLNAIFSAKIGVLNTTQSGTRRKVNRRILLETLQLEDRLQPAVVVVPASDGPAVDIPVVESQNGVLNLNLDMVRAGVPGSGESILYGSKPLYSNTQPPAPPTAGGPPYNPANYAAAYQVVFPDGTRMPAQFPGVVMKVKQGDRLNVQITNSLGVPNSAPTPTDERLLTNFHTHGYLVSPLGTSDNVYRVMESGNTYSTTVDIPDYQPSGVGWYHVHKHGFVADQVNAGLAGVLQTGSPLDYFPQYLGKYAEKVFTLSLTNKQQTPNGLMMTTAVGQTPFFLNPATNTPVGWQKYVNGQLNPTMTMKPGETQIWTFVNSGRNGAYNLGLADGNGENPWQSTLLSYDGNGQNATPRSYLQVQPSTFVTNSLMSIDPGERLTVAVTAPSIPGTYYLQDNLLPNYLTSFNPFALMTINVEGGGAVEPQPVFGATGVVPDLYDPNIKVDNYRNFNFSFDGTGPGGTTAFKINGQTFPNGPLVNLQAGQVEEWTFSTNQINPHPIHLHQNDIAIIAINGQKVMPNGTGAYPYVSLRDTANIPANGSITIRFRVRPLPGKYVFHCHILMHEDGGMMVAVMAGPNASQRRVAAGNLSGSTPVLNPRADGEIYVYGGSGETLGKITTPRSYKGGWATATGDLNGDMVQEIVIGPANPVRSGPVVIYDGNTLKEIGRFNAFPDLGNSGVSLAVADVNNDKKGEIIVGRVGKGRSLVRIFSLSGRMLRQIQSTFTEILPNGVNVAAADFNGDNFDDIAIGAGPGALPRVIGLDGYSLSTSDARPTELFNFLTDSRKIFTGVNVAAGYLSPQTSPSYQANLVTAPATGMTNAVATVWEMANAMEDMGGMGNMPGMDHGNFTGMPKVLNTIQPFGVLKKVPGGMRFQVTQYGTAGTFALASWNKPKDIVYQSIDNNGKVTTLQKGQK